MACSTTGYTGQNYCDKNSRFGKPTGIMFAIDGNTNTAANFLLEATWDDDVEAQQVFPLQNMKAIEDLSTEPTYKDYDDGSRRLMEQGNYRFAVSFDVNECVKKQLLNFRGFQEGIYLVYGDVIRGRTVDSGVNIVPIRLENVNIEKGNIPTMADTEMVKIVIDLKSDKDLNEYDYSRKMAWDVDDVDGLTEVTVTMVTEASDAVVVDVTADCGGQTKQISGIDDTGVLSFTNLNGSTPVAVTAVAESATVRGRYTISSTFATGYFVDLASPVDRIDTVKVISSGKITLGTIS